MSDIWPDVWSLMIHVIINENIRTYAWTETNLKWRRDRNVCVHYLSTQRQANLTDAHRAEHARKFIQPEILTNLVLNFCSETCTSGIYIQRRVHYVRNMYTSRSPQVYLHVLFTSRNPLTLYLVRVVAFCESDQNSNEVLKVAT